MVRRSATLAVALCIGSPTVSVQEISQDGPASFAVAVAQTVDSLAGEEIWPGFDARRVPLAIYDGTNTYLFRHPTPPDGFVMLDSGGVFVYAGRHEAMRANTHTMLGDVSTATVLSVGGSERDARALGGVAIHEAFHVFQRKRYPDWSANEVDLMVYPVEDAALLALRRMETEAIRRAFANDEGGSRAACWVNTALRWRTARYSRLAAPFVDYERGIALIEGMARYVQNRSLGSGRPEVPRNGFAPANIRARQYVVGQAMAVLLDRFSPGWIDGLRGDGMVSLDSILTGALLRTEQRTCDLTHDEQSDIEQKAARDVRAHIAFRDAEETRFRDQVGWTLVVIAADGEPLWPQGFDPLNVLRTDTNDVLHQRWLKAGNDAGTIEILDRASLTTGAGTHPLFNGIAKIVVTGLHAEPTQRERDGEVNISATGVTGTFRAATTELQSQTLIVRLRSR